MGVLDEAEDGELGKRWGLAGAEENRVPAAPFMPHREGALILLRAARALYDSRQASLSSPGHHCAPDALWDDLGEALRG